jgi:asparagine synthase (glutamine-hydrolysing)
MAADWAPERRRQHPWLRDARWSLPGRRARITAVLRIQHLLDPVLRPSPVPLLHPLLTQPVIETCLSIPSWLWVTGGIDRAAARAAFRAQLPELVVQRRGKGSLHAYFVKVYRQSRQALRELLLGGVLARRGFIDEGAVAAYLDRPDHKVDPGFYRLFELADVELWLRAWSAG